MPGTDVRLLVLDGGTETLHLGLCDGARCELLRALPGGARASSVLLPALMGLLDEAGLALSALDAIAVGRGPGAFTGVRAACAVAQGLAYGATLPVLALDSLMAVAEHARQAGAPADRCLWVAVDARMGEAYAAAYRHRGADAGWETVSAPALWQPAALARRIAADDAESAVAGNSLQVHAEVWQGMRRASCWPGAEPDAAALLALARRAWAAGAARDAAEALPLYVRDKVAQTSVERAAAAAAASAATPTP